MVIDPFTAARVRIASLQASILKSGFDEGRHPRDNHGRWSVGDSVEFTPHGSQPGGEKVQGTIVGSNKRDMTHSVEDANGITHEVPTENLSAPSHDASAGTMGEIARKHLGVNTLSEGNSDSADFHNVSVWGAKSALNAAYQAGGGRGDLPNAEAIAAEHLGIGTLRTRNSDSLDFHDVHVGNIASALSAAHAAGKK